MPSQAFAIANPTGVSRPSARIKTLPEDWQVTEVYDPIFREAGEHTYLYVEKRCLSTVPVAQWLSQQFEVPLVDVGYAGMKDKHAVTRQWFSVRQPGNVQQAQSSDSVLNPVPNPVPDPKADLKLDEGETQIRVLSAHQHHRKLRRGEHQGNAFTVVLRELTETVDHQALIAGIEAGFPNYFGPQRFGRHNLADALDWLLHRRRRKISRRTRGWHLSVLRSWIFNQLLADRVVDGTWQQLLEGDVAVSGHGQALALGPLWGRGREVLAGPALSRQQQTLAAPLSVAEAAAVWRCGQTTAPDSAATITLGEVCEALEYAGVDRGQRPLWVAPWDVQCQSSGSTLTLSFCLPVGAYATVMLANHFELLDVSVEHSL